MQEAQPTCSWEHSSAIVIQNSSVGDTPQSHNPSPVPFGVLQRYERHVRVLASIELMSCYAIRLPTLF